MLNSVVLVSAVQQCESPISIHIFPSLLSLPPHSPIQPLYVLAEHRAEIPVLCSSFPLAVLHVVVYMSMLFSQFVPPSPSPTHTCRFVPLPPLSKYRAVPAQDGSCYPPPTFFSFFFGCAGSSLLRGLFFSCGDQGLLYCCSELASHCCGFSCCGARTLGCLDFSGCRSWALEHRLSSCGAQT